MAAKRQVSSGSSPSRPPPPAHVVRQAHHERAGGARTVDPCFRRGGQLAQGWLRRGQLPPYSNHSCEGRTPSLGRGGGPAPHSPLWVPASAGTTTPQPSFLPPRRNPSLGRGGAPRPIPPSGYPRPIPPLDARFRGHGDGRTRRGPLTWVRGPLSSVGVATVGLCRGGSRTAPTLGYVCRRQSLAVRLLRCGAASVPRLPPHPRLSVSGWLSAISGTRRRLRQPA